MIYNIHFYKTKIESHEKENICHWELDSDTSY